MSFLLNSSSLLILWHSYFGNAIKPEKELIPLNSPGLLKVIIVFDVFYHYVLSNYSFLLKLWC